MRKRYFDHLVAARYDAKTSDRYIYQYGTNRKVSKERLSLADKAA